MRYFDDKDRGGKIQEEKRQDRNVEIQRDRYGVIDKYHLFEVNLSVQVQQRNFDGAQRCRSALDVVPIAHVDHEEDTNGNKNENEREADEAPKNELGQSSEKRVRREVERDNVDESDKNHNPR